MRRLSVLLALATFGCGVAGGGEDATSGGSETSTSAHPQFKGLYDSYLHRCSHCHSPNGPGRPTTAPIEKTLDFTDVDTAWNTIRNGEASGLAGTNAEACQGVPFVGQTYEESLIAAVIDENVRANFSTGSGCTGDAIGDMAFKTGASPTDSFYSGLKAWIDGGAP